MLRAIRKAYGAGYRAGMTPRPVITRPNGTKTLATINNPYGVWWQFPLLFAYEQGVYTGTMKSLKTWLAERRA